LKVWTACKTATKWVSENYKIGDGSRSALTYYVAARLRENYGFTDGEIIAEPERKGTILDG
jgi:hypothetical protein